MPTVFNGAINLPSLYIWCNYIKYSVHSVHCIIIFPALSKSPHSKKLELTENFLTIRTNLNTSIGDNKLAIAWFIIGLLGYKCHFWIQFNFHSEFNLFSKRLFDFQRGIFYFQNNIFDMLWDRFDFHRDIWFPKRHIFDLKWNIFVLKWNIF